MTMKGPYRELIPAPPQKVKIQVPSGTQVTGVQLLVSGEPVGVEQGDGWIGVVVASVLDHEVIAVDLEVVN